MAAARAGEHLLLFGRDALTLDLVEAAVRHDGWPAFRAAGWRELVEAAGRLPAWAVVVACPLDCPASFLHCSCLCRRGNLHFLLAARGEDLVARCHAAARGALLVGHPLDPRQLLARLRQLFLQPPAGREGEPCGLLRLSRDALLDLDRREVVYRGLHLALSGAEYRLAVMLAREPGRVRAPEELAEAAPGAAPDGRRQRLYAAVRSLRDKMGDPEGTILRNVRGRGYLLAVADGNPDVPPPEEVCDRPAGERWDGGIAAWEATEL